MPDLGPEPRMVLWRRLDRPGHEITRLSFVEATWRLEGTAVFTEDRQVCRLEYRVVCDAGWRTQSARVSGSVGDENVQLEIRVDAASRWWLNDVEQPQVEGCLDLDLNFSPVTNTLPIRRLELAVGQAAEVRAAWLRFPSFKLEPLAQLYRREAAGRYVYESAGGAFHTHLAVDPDGFVTFYPKFWRLVSGKDQQE